MLTEITLVKLYRYTMTCRPTLGALLLHTSFFLMTINAELHFSYVPSTGWLGFFGMIHNQLL